MHNLCFVFGVGIFAFTTGYLVGSLYTKDSSGMEPLLWAITLTLFASIVFLLSTLYCNRCMLYSNKLQSKLSPILSNPIQNAPPNDVNPAMEWVVNSRPPVYTFHGYEPFFEQ